jgi:hypothetical protein
MDVTFNPPRDDLILSKIPVCVLNDAGDEQRLAHHLPH